LNCIESNNFKRRNNINNYRKSRALFDKLFKGIEENIYKEEKKIVKQIKSLRKTEKKQKKVEQELSQLDKVLKNDHRDQLAKEIEKVYQENFVEYQDDDDLDLLAQLSPKDFSVNPGLALSEKENLNRMSHNMRKTCNFKFLFFNLK
jgi:predicted outer membrane protein